MNIPHKVLSRNGYLINTKKITKRKLTQVKKELTVKPIVHKDYSDEVPSYPIYKENNNSLCMPRYYGVKKFGKPNKILPLEGLKSKMKFKGRLREYQQEIIEKSMETFKTKGGGILSLACGMGKTVIAIYLACKLGLKTLVLVHKTFLQNQWYERIKQFTNAKIGMIRQKKIDIKNRDIVIAMLQSVSMIDYDSDIFKDFGLVIYDECHHAASKVFSQALFKTGTKYTLGLSATPFRADGLTKILYWYLGEIYYRKVRKGSRGVIVKMFDYESNDILFKAKKMWRNGKIIPAIQKMITNVGKIRSRNNFIVNIINGIRNQYERKILILSGRINHLELLKEKVDKIIEDEVKRDLLEPNECTTAFYIGRMKEYELRDAADADIIFASYAMAEEGLDIDKLNTLILATPKRNIVQSIGRILRKPIKDGDLNPLIIDIVDQFSMFDRWGGTRRKYYDKNKYNIDYYKGFNDNIIGMREYLVKKKIIKPKENIDVRKAYIIHSQGEDQYYFQEEFDFMDEPEEKYYYEPDLEKILNLDVFRENPLEMA